MSDGLLLRLLLEAGDKLRKHTWADPVDQAAWDMLKERTQRTLQDGGHFAPRS